MIKIVVTAILIIGAFPVALVSRDVGNSEWVTWGLATALVVIALALWLPWSGDKSR